MRVRKEASPTRKARMQHSQRPYSLTPLLGGHGGRGHRDEGAVGLLDVHVLDDGLVGLLEARVVVHPILIAVAPASTRMLGFRSPLPASTRMLVFLDLV